MKHCQYRYLPIYIHLFVLSIPLLSHHLTFLHFAQSEHSGKHKLLNTCTSHLFTQKVSDFNSRTFTFDDAINGKMCIYSAHFIQKALQNILSQPTTPFLSNVLIYLCYASNHIGYERFHSPKTSVMFSATLPHS